MNIKFLIIGLTLALVLGLGMTAAGERLDGLRVLANSVAKTACTCIFVEGRLLEDCLADSPVGTDLAATFLDEQAQSVHSSVYWVVRGRARYEGETGCILD